MQRDDREGRRESYLFDPEAAPDREVLALEETLRPFRYRIEERELQLPRREADAKPSSMRFLAAFAVAAAGLFILAIGLRAWIWSWPDGRPWEISNPPPGEGRSLGEGERLRVDAEKAALVRIARIGRMRVDPGSEIELVRTGGKRHRLTLERGSIAIGVWAPPFSVAIRTPEGFVYDMGCAFELQTGGGSTAVRVTSGWVQLENEFGEVLVPEGAEARMARGSGPTVPLFAGASERFRMAVRRLEEREGSGADVEIIRDSAEARDAYTLLLLSERVPEHRADLIVIASDLAPAPSAAVQAEAAEGNLYAIWEWVQSLDLPPPKGWVRNWRDALVGFRE
jgi:ferric-dicitrate binding protein FerR (iron transport regulator)